ncbi:MAG TPA: bifunctional diaminohydroxyphosphoribosylaminopyrimidine deaminase/5-amino-6-(5-phosphoribosylamino)uracil reductase RibD, partial [Bacteroidetes bacterium]|nr:bifunctional diaminohydroxyphosphoribosylaminopyrimidine deaminase/5-amino-6-(5-phosphoribosylamino)uracil reductase RibD [Bacteroidota bacterium]
MENESDHIFLQRCLELARIPGAAVEPNPRVGAVLVHAGKIIGEGYHRKYGGPHAEVNAVLAVKDLSLLKASTLYVSLEPCNHQGLTPPCTNLILEHGIPRVVIGSLDPHPLMQGKSVALLRAQGVEVVLGTNPELFHAMNAHFRLHQHLKRPFISLKWAESQDGFIAGQAADGNLSAARISGSQVSRWVHFQRGQHQAILVGRHTVEVDNPSLTTRKWPGPDPVKIVFDGQLALLGAERSWEIFQNGRVILLNTLQHGTKGNVEFFDISGLELEEIFQKLYLDYKIGSVLVEGGAETHQQFLNAGFWDEIWRNIGAITLGNGLSAPEIKAEFRPSEIVH